MVSEHSSLRRIGLLIAASHCCQRQRVLGWFDYKLPHGGLSTERVTRQGTLGSHALVAFIAASA